MLSYQHLYHAGNPADVHKHAVLAAVLAYLTAKDKPLSYIETHAGRGLYNLGADEAQKTGEARAGILRLEPMLRPDHPYRRALDGVRARHGVDAYAGSPLIATELLRPTDKIHLAELHPTEFAELSDAVPPWRTWRYQQDGLDLALSLTPPMPRRGLMLIDPSYEVKTDYEAIPEVMAQVHRRWNVGIILLWYPLLDSAPHQPMLRALQGHFPEGLRHEVRFPPVRPGHRMTGSGLWIVNPPFGTAKAATEVSRLFA